MKTIIPPIDLEPILFNQRAVLYSPEIQLSMWEDELKFYHRLLTWWLLSCLEEDKPAIEALNVQLNELRERNFLALKENSGLKQFGAGHTYFLGTQVTTDLHDTYYHFEQRLNSFKAKIFKGFMQFGHVQIW